MSKELELLNEVEKSFLYGTAGQYKEQLKTEYIEPIKQALTELEELKIKINQLLNSNTAGFNILEYERLLRDIVGDKDV